MPSGEPYYGNLAVEAVAVALHAPQAVLHTEYQRGTLDALLWARVPAP